MKILNKYCLVDTYSFDEKSVFYFLFVLPILVLFTERIAAKDDFEFEEPMQVDSRTANSNSHFTYKIKPDGSKVLSTGEKTVFGGNVYLSVPHSKESAFELDVGSKSLQEDVSTKDQSRSVMYRSHYQAKDSSGQLDDLTFGQILTECVPVLSKGQCKYESQHRVNEDGFNVFMNNEAIDIAPK